MKVRLLRLRFLGLFLLAGFVLLGVSFDEAAAQPTRRPKAAKIRPKAQPTPLPTAAEIISRDNDYSVQNQIIEPETTEAQSDTTVENADDLNARMQQLNKELNQRVQQLEAERKNNSDDKSKRLLLNLDILTRAEQRAETLRKQMFEMIEKESQIQTKLDQIANDIRPELLERNVAFAGSLRPEELREARRKNLEIERKNLQTLLSDIQTVRANLESSVQKSDLLVQKLRDKLEKEIDNSLADDPQN